MTSSKDMVGIYAAIEKTLRAAASLFFPFIQAAQPYWVQAWHLKEVLIHPFNLKKYSIILFILSIMVAFISYLFSEWGLSLLFDRSISQFSFLAKILSFWLPFFIFNSMISSWWWVASGRERLMAKRSLPGVLLQASVFSWMLFIFNIEFALWGWVLCEVIMSMLLIYRSGFLSK
jgi:O-antigen/teichoic acid export membrane protein